jgi:hypothetical protein
VLVSFEFGGFADCVELIEAAALAAFSFFVELGRTLEAARTSAAPALCSVVPLSALNVVGANRLGVSAASSVAMAELGDEFTKESGGSGGAPLAGRALGSIPELTV